MTTETEEEYMFTCNGCGETYWGDPPDEEHAKPEKKKEESKETIAVNYVCPDCGETNTVHWGVGKV
jgi:rubredoxin